MTVVYAIFVKMVSYYHLLMHLSTETPRICKFDVVWGMSLDEDSTDIQFYIRDFYQRFGWWCDGQFYTGTLFYNCIEQVDLLTH